jgi:hypothetical protein
MEAAESTLTRPAPPVARMLDAVAAEQLRPEQRLTLEQRANLVRILRREKVQQLFWAWHAVGARTKAHHTAEASDLQALIDLFEAQQ